MKISNGLQWEIKKFNKEIQDLRGLGELPDGPLAVERAEALKQKVFQAITSGQKPAEAEPSLKWNLFAKGQGLLRYAVSVLLGLSLVGGSAFASTSAKPGEALYPIKRFKEKIELGLALTEQAKAGLQARFAQERLQELQYVSFQDPPEIKNLQTIPASGQVATTAPGPRPTVENNLSVTQKHLKIKMRARQDAEAAVTDAVEALEQIQSKLKANGETQAANLINDDILNLSGQAKYQDIYPLGNKAGNDKKHRDTKNENSSSP